MTKKSEESKSEEAKQKEMFNEAVAKFARAGVGNPSMLSAMFEGASQHVIAVMMRTQLERIADAMEVEALGVRMHDGSLDYEQIDRRHSAARRFLLDKILARVEREALAEAGRAATAPVSFAPHMCPGGCGREVIDGKRTCGEARCGRTTP